MVILTQNRVVNGLLQKYRDDYDRGEALMRSSMSEDEIKEVVQNLYRVFFLPEYIVRKLASVWNSDDLKFIMRGMSKTLGTLGFSRSETDR